MSNPERHGGEQDFAKSVEHQKHSELIHKYEQKTLGTEAPQHNEVENARKEALDYALEEKQYKPHEQHETAPIRPSVASGAKLKQSFDKTMDRVRTDMPLPQKVFSKLIHNQAVEKASDIVGSTVARPDAILSGSACAFVLTTAIYFTARYYGFSLSGSETIATFVAGWLLGLLFDLLKRMFKRH